VPHPSLPLVLLHHPLSQHQDPRSSLLLLSLELLVCYSPLFLFFLLSLLS
jgi:hypothetical protein